MQFDSEKVSARAAIRPSEVLALPGISRSARDYLRQNREYPSGKTGFRADLKIGSDDSMKDDSDYEIMVFTEALKVPVQERGAFLERVCTGDENLRHKVESLLRAHDRLGNFLDEPPTGAPAE